MRFENNDTGEIFKSSYIIAKSNVWDLGFENINQGQCTSKTAHCKYWQLRFDRDDIKKISLE